MRRPGTGGEIRTAADVDDQFSDRRYPPRGGSSHLHPLGPIVYAGPIFYSADADGDLLRLFREWAPGASDDITAILDLTTAPPLPVIPEAWHGQKVAPLADSGFALFCDVLVPAVS